MGISNALEKIEHKNPKVVENRRKALLKRFFGEEVRQYSDPADLFERSKAKEVT